MQLKTEKKGPNRGKKKEKIFLSDFPKNINDEIAKPLWAQISDIWFILCVDKLELICN